MVATLLRPRADETILDNEGNAAADVVGDHVEEEEQLHHLKSSDSRRYFCRPCCLLLFPLFLRKSSGRLTQEEQPDGNPSDLSCSEILGQIDVFSD